MKPTEQLSSFLLEHHPREAARSMASLEVDLVANLLVELPPSIAANLTRHMSTTAALQCLRALDSGTVASIIESMPSDSAARILDRSDDETCNAILQNVKPRAARSISMWRQLREENIEVLVEPVDALSADMTVEEARKYAAHTSNPYCYIVNATSHLVGVVKVTTLWKEPLERRLRSIMQTRVICLNHRTAIAAAAKHPAWADYDVLPIVDAHSLFVGALRHKSIRRRLGRKAERTGLDVAVSTLLDLSQLYWTTGASLLLGPTQRHDRKPGSEHGGSHA